MKITNIIKNILFIIALFTISAALVFTNIYGESALKQQNILILALLAAVINSTALISAKTNNTLYAVSTLFCFAALVYPVCNKLNYLLCGNNILLGYTIALIAFIPAVFLCLITIYNNLSKKEKKNFLLKIHTKKFPLITVLIIALTAIILSSIYMVKTAINISADIDTRKTVYADSINLANDIATEYAQTDKPIELILQENKLTYEHAQNNLYIFENKSGVDIKIDMSSVFEKDKSAGSIYVCSDSIGIELPQIYEKTFYHSENTVILLN